MCFWFIWWISKITGTTLKYFSYLTFNDDIFPVKTELAFVYILKFYLLFSFANEGQKK